VITINEGLTLATAVDKRYTESFLCGGLGLSDCPVCHPSCTSCTSGSVCDSCKHEQSVMSADSLFCSCSGQNGYAAADKYHESCASCYNGCATCESAATSNDCQSCLFNYHKGPCVGVSCTCLGSSDEEMFVEFAKEHGLPYTDETNSMICYRQPVPEITCDPLPSAVTGTISEDVAGLHPTQAQCDELLHTQWPWVMVWFGKLFSDMTLPQSATAEDIVLVINTIYALILKQGPATLNGDQSWKDFVGVFNQASPPWDTLLGWPSSADGTTTPAGYSIDGSTVLPLPTGLTLTSTSLTLILLNHFSEVCTDNYGCPLFNQCSIVDPMSVCVTP